ncbi:putative other/FunK1 kinase [Rhizoctonia solani 123E]|uniref:Putative other/FunK1 kinase n=1 Tax=Rhizoctonia solani 123E TaxID=1423351 RepID=A0A074S8G9_9AGAM|nr:putative other/FunK1 kinase [Rhizoctonia solani 123E]
MRMQVVTKEIGQPLEGVHSLRKFLCVMYDACAVQRNLYRKCKILHRDISDKNIMFAPNTEAYRERNRSGYGQVKFVNQVLARGGNADPVPACLMIDLGNGADLETKRGKGALTERTGTPKFIARSVSSGKLLNEDIFSSARVKMPLMEGVLTDYHRSMDATEYQVDSPGSNTQSEFAHRLFHDAESTFWVIAWTLARSIQAGSEQEKEPHIIFSQFFHTMSSHYPIPGGDDSRHTFTYGEKEDWESVLHPDLAVLAPMLASMFRYIRPEWAYRPELNAEHVHEALMRLLLIEIINIKNGSDIDIHLGGRNPPPQF